MYMILPLPSTICSSSRHTFSTARLFSGAWHNATHHKQPRVYYIFFGLDHVRPEGAPLINAVEQLHILLQYLKSFLLNLLVNLHKSTSDSVFVSITSHAAKSPWKVLYPWKNVIHDCFDHNALLHWSCGHRHVRVVPPWRSAALTRIYEISIWGLAVGLVHTWWYVHSTAECSLSV